MRIEQLTFTRFIAAVFIVLFHYAPNEVFVKYLHLTPVINLAGLWVMYFFLLSGFVMVFANTKNGVFKKINFAYFYLSRLIRIYPAYIIALILSILVIVAKGDHIDVSEVLITVFMLQAWIPEYGFAINYTSWSVSVEVFFYFIFPFVFNEIYLRCKYNGILLGSLFVFAVFVFFVMYLSQQSFFITHPVFTNSFPLFYVNIFLLGCASCLVFFNTKIERYGNMDLFLILIVLLITYLIYLKNIYHFSNQLLAIPFAFFIIVLAKNNGWITKLFCFKPLVFLGEISYGIYIFQHPVYKLNSFVAKKLHMEVSFLFFFISLIVVTSLMFLYVEKPLGSYCKSWMKKKMNDGLLNESTSVK